MFAKDHVSKRSRLAKDQDKEYIKVRKRSRFAKDQGQKKIKVSNRQILEKIKVRKISRSGKDQGQEQIKVGNRSRSQKDYIIVGSLCRRARCREALSPLLRAVASALVKGDRRPLNQSMMVGVTPPLSVDMTEHLKRNFRILLQTADQPIRVSESARFGTSPAPVTFIKRLRLQRFDSVFTNIRIFLILILAFVKKTSRRKHYKVSMQIMKRTGDYTKSIV